MYVTLVWEEKKMGEPSQLTHMQVGTYLFRRISTDGGTDSRFTSIRHSAPKFLTAFFLQATWVAACLMPVLALNSIPASLLLSSSLPRSILLTDILGLSLFAGGLGLEITADRQKEAWQKEKREKKHEEDFLTRGLWSRSRHPNYFGEMVLWSGIAVVAGGVLVRRAGLAGMGFNGAGGLGAGAGSLLKPRLLALTLAGISPAFVTCLLLFVSGIPLSENKYDARYGEREDYRKWKRETPVLVPRVF